MAANTVDLADELSKLAERLEEAANDLQRRRPGDMPARGKLANEYAILAGDRLLRAAQHKAIRDHQLLAHLDVDHPDEGQKRNLAFLHAIQRWLPAVSPDHRPDKHNVARRYADDLRALGAAINRKDERAGYLGIGLDEDNCRAIRNGKTADFAGNVISWKLFCFMYRRKDAYASQQDLLRAGWTDQHIVAPETVQRHISTIRSIVKRLSVEIENERNVGYRLIEKKPRA